MFSSAGLLFLCAHQNKTPTKPAGHLPAQDFPNLFARGAQQAFNAPVVPGPAFLSTTWGTLSLSPELSSSPPQTHKCAASSSACLQDVVLGLPLDQTSPGLWGNSCCPYAISRAHPHPFPVLTTLTLFQHNKLHS